MEKLEKIESKCPFKLFLRVRPQKNGNTTLLDFYNPKDSKHMHIISPKDSFTYKKGRLEGDFEYEHIFSPESSQEIVFDRTTKSLLDGFLQGTSCLVMAYGVTGSGKTYTILGPNENQGLVPRALQYILSGMNSLQFKEKFKEDEVSLEMSFLEDYQNNIYDLLSPSRPGTNTKPSLSIRSNNQGLMHVVDLTEKRVKTVKEGMELIDFGTREKHVAETSMNVDSSRSHTMCTFNLVRTSSYYKEVIASCRIVDLAGSERASRTNVSGERTKEAGAINSDLLFLMQSLRMLTDDNKNNIRVACRNCKLTYLLSSSLYGPKAGPVHMIINISNEKADFDETFYVLEQTTIVQTIKTVTTKINTTSPPIRIPGMKRGDLPLRPMNGAAMNGADVERYKRLLSKTDKELQALKEKYDKDIQAAVAMNEIEVRRSIVQEIQRRRQNGENENDHVLVQIENMRKQYEMMGKQLEDSYELKIKDYQMSIKEMQNQIKDVEKENKYLHLALSVLTTMEEWKGDDSSPNVTPASYEQIIENVENLIQQCEQKDAAIKYLNEQLDQEKATPDKREILELQEKNEELMKEKQKLEDEMKTMNQELKRLKEENKKLENAAKKNADETAYPSNSIKRMDFVPSVPTKQPPPLPGLKPVSYNSGSLHRPLNTNSLKGPLQLNHPSPPTTPPPNRPGQQIRPYPVGSQMGSPTGSPRLAPLNVSPGSPTGSPRLAPLNVSPGSPMGSRVPPLGTSMRSLNGSPRNAGLISPPSAVSALTGSRNLTPARIPPISTTGKKGMNLSIDVSSPNGNYPEAKSNNNFKYV